MKLCKIKTSKSLFAQMPKTKRLYPLDCIRIYLGENTDRYILVFVSKKYKFLVGRSGRFTTGVERAVPINPEDITPLLKILGEQEEKIVELALQGHECCEVTLRGCFTLEEIWD